ncbi:MAG: SDR family oxidoreductase [Candidatus Odinarchaeota archaeon]
MQVLDGSVLVLGGTGHYGRHIVRSLLEMGEPVKVLTRNSVKAREILGNGPDLIKGDITSKESVVEALSGVKVIIISVSAFSRKLIRKLTLIERDSVLMLLEEAKKAGISRIVYISTFDIKKDLTGKFDIPQANIKLDIEEALAISDFNWTVLGAPPSIEIFFAMIRGDRMMVPGGGPPALPTLSPVDMGKIAAQAAVRTDLSKKRFRLTGPEAMSFPEAARRIASVTGKPITFRKIPLLPLRVVSLITRPFSPYLRLLLKFVLLLNKGFTEDVVATIPEDYQLLRQTFDYQPTTLEMQAKAWVDTKQKTFQQGSRE